MVVDIPIVIVHELSIGSDPIPVAQRLNYGEMQLPKIAFP